MKKPMALRMEPSESGGYEIWLDDKKLHHIKDYKIESLSFKGAAELSIKMLVQYPVKKENTSLQPPLQLPEEPEVTRQKPLP